MKATFKKRLAYQADALNLPVADVDAAVPFYETMMGFSVESRRDEPHRSAGDKGSTKPISSVPRWNTHDLKVACLPC